MLFSGTEILTLSSAVKEPNCFVMFLASKRDIVELIRFKMNGKDKKLCGSQCLHCVFSCTHPPNPLLCFAKKGE
jgi:hypothetical protein